jgi:hypothetical protein
VAILDRSNVTGKYSAGTFLINGGISNAENIVIIKSAGLAAVYTDNFMAHLRHAVKYGR